MKNLEKGQEIVREEIDSLKGMMSKILENLQTLMYKEDQPQQNMHTDNGISSSFSLGPQQIQGENIQFPSFGLPQNYTPSFANATNRGPSIQPHVQIPVITEVHPGGFSAHQGPFEDPYLVFHAAGPQDTHPEICA
ncbi:hypothetical protein KIW84_054488 [Lathyrus oleraceus]|uniref:Uncharacterized protein n=1 Tax=Pisum sativum TaxID=3888 RepID=A0A9D5AID6_PEA|nr:hypothetical protein KIW84_054488 [Pisum sativum]